MQWVTRERPKIDRIACPWLIARFIDQAPAFLFVPSADVLPVAQQTGAIPYDSPGVELSHVGARSGCPVAASPLSVELAAAMLTRMRRVRIFVIGLLMLWLPLQAVAAVSMPFCAHTGAAHAAHAAAPGQHHHSGSMPDSDSHGHQHGDQHPAAGSLQCNDCGACNLACAPAVPASVVLPLAAPVTAEPDFLARSYGLFVPEQPQPPPNSHL